MNKRSYVIIAAAAVILLTMGVFFFNSSRTTVNKDGQTVLVTTAKAEINSVDATPVQSGKLEALESANVVSKITGRVGTVNVDIGGPVKAGDVLVTLDANELAASVSQAAAAVEVARSTLASAEIDYETAKSNYERNQTLLEQGVISQSTFDSSYSQPFKKAEQYAMYGAPAALRQAEAAMQLAQANYANSIITSPIDGIVTAKNISPGELATTSTTLVTVVNLDQVVMQTAVDENYINRLKEGDPLPVRVSAVSEQPFPGTISNIAQAASTSTKGFTVKVLIDNPDHRLKPGMFAEASPGGNGIPELVVPKVAVIEENGKNFVWVVENGTVLKKEVITGTAGVTREVIKSGIAEGQEVVTSGIELLKEGDRVSTGQ